jgi:[acyl-carrier-protein] S-malonyltransferase
MLLDARPRGPWPSDIVGAGMPRIAALFPGQGSQKVGMGADFMERFPELRGRYFDAADEILDFALTDLILNGPVEELQSTDNTQPAIFTTSLAILDALRGAGVDPQAVAGHSLGEYSALVAAGVLDFEPALRLVRRRGELMAGVNAKTPGTMAAVIGLPASQVDELCATAAADGGVVEAANYNDPEQTVISGEVEPVGRAVTLAEQAGARVVPLRVGAPFHCSLMSVLGEDFGAALDDCAFADPKIPVIANVTGDYVRTGAEAREALRAQVAGAVRWTDTMQRFAADGYDTFVEAGPGRVLSGFAMKITPELTCHSAGEVRRFDKALPALTA